MHTYIVTHKPIDWPIPFEHKLVTVNGYREEGAMDASDYIGELNMNRTFAWYGGIEAILQSIKDLPDDDHIAIYPYRHYLSSKLCQNLDHVVYPNEVNVEGDELPYREIITPEDLQLNWRSKVLLDFPEEYDLVISRPVRLYLSSHQQQISFLQQHAYAHRVDDLLFGTAVAVRAGLIDPQVTAYVMSNPVLILTPHVSKVSFFRYLYERIWWIAKEIYSKHYVQRVGYQERSINFTLERIISIYLTQKIYVEKVPAACTSTLHISPELEYKASP